ncbi:hypothetical protein [Brevibacterium luteolum]|uniref:hypothetical protein n=1 Tax=Brevibacterium luteolum TaxID=199591 RepID=UPI00223BC0CC|nr:hypothetical protein [Brevibacterium luteolum]MCT1874380.1 hypothetical protein [Brevibacterium luteolum]MCT1889619.1 hypothetical protein [Brevibacterium luteolum]MCT1893268.1 hypothetical protein [Brevibacterium luteolum]MCT1922942.1 hypothetical protein [Brevibacterium luteolum]
MRFDIFALTVCIAGFLGTCALIVSGAISSDLAALSIILNAGGAIISGAAIRRRLKEEE